MKNVLVSLKPYYYYLVGEGIKEIEVRKSMPKSSDWNKTVYFYMSKDEKSFAKIPKEYQEKYRKHFGKVGLKFVCDRIDEYFYDQAFDESMGCFINKYGYEITSYELAQTCLSYEEFEKYGNTNALYGWHISDLKIYDKPKSLEMFPVGKIARDCGCGGYMIYNKVLTRPPQSWCYVEV